MCSISRRVSNRTGLQVRPCSLQGYQGVHTGQCGGPVLDKGPSHPVRFDSGDSAMNNGSDVLARGCPTAQFAGASSGITEFENDFIYKEVAEVMEKYGLSQAEYDQYQAQ